jgi:putative CocE/NonD family hydrolase
MRHAPEAQRLSHYLVIGPWDHLGTSSSRAEFGGLKFPPQSLVNFHQLHLEWYTWTILGGRKPEFLRKRVAYYVMGAERWRYADALEEVTSHHECYYLCSPGSAGDVFASGSLATAGSSGPPDSYIYDPRTGCGETRVGAEAYIDQTMTMCLQGSQFVYHSPPFTADTEVSGFFKLRVWLAIDCSDTDFYISVYEVALTGVVIRLSTDMMRARYREGLRTPKLINTREPLCYDFDGFTFVSREIRRGHRLRLVIAPIGSDGPVFQKNYQGGGVVCDEPASEARAVTVRLFHDETYPSTLHVPVGQLESFSHGEQASHIA